MGAIWKNVVLCLLLAVIAIEAVGFEPDYLGQSQEDVQLLTSYLDSVKHLMNDETFNTLTQDLREEASRSHQKDISHFQDEHFNVYHEAKDMRMPRIAEPSSELPELNLTRLEYYMLPRAVIDPTDVSTVDNSDYDASKPLYIVISDHPAHLLQTMVKRYFSTIGTQMILVNWGGVFEAFKDPASADKTFSVAEDDFDIYDLMHLELFRMPDYRSLTKVVTPVVRGLKDLFSTIEGSCEGLTRENIRFVCSGIGCQIAARVGRYYNGTFGSITAISPAKERYDTLADTKILDSTDAVSVIVIHTHGEEYGMETPRGDADIYLLMDSVCRTAPIPDHYFFCPYVLGLLAFSAFDHEFSEDLIRPAAYKCDTKEAFVTGECPMTESLLLGIDMNPAASGLYFHFLNLNRPVESRNLVQSIGSFSKFSSVIQECTNGHTDGSGILTSVHRLTVSANANNPALVEVYDYSRYLTVHHPDDERETTVKLMISPPMTHAISAYEYAIDEQAFPLVLRFRNIQMKSGNFSLRDVIMEDFTNTTEGCATTYYGCNVDIQPWYEYVLHMDTTMC